MPRKSKAKAKPKARKTKPKAKKAEAKKKPKTHGQRVAIYFGKSQGELLTWAREHAAKQGVGLNRIVMNGLRNVHQLETGDVLYGTVSDSGPAEEQATGEPH